MRFQTIVFAGLLVLTLSATAGAADIVLIVHKSNDISSVSPLEANNIFHGKKTTWSTGKKIALLTQRNQQVHDSFVKQILGKTAQQFATYWKKALFTGTGIPPQAVDGDAEIKAFVAANKDAISYISSAALDSTVKKLVLN